MSYLAVANWSKYQHYKNRRPPWVKFYTTLSHPSHPLNQLPVSARYVFYRMLLLAAEWDNAIPNDSELLAKLLGMETGDYREAVALLVKGRWLSQRKTMRRASKQSASKSLPPEAETDLEGESITANRSELRVPIDDEKRHELRRIIALCRDVNGGSMSVLEAEAGGLPLASLAKVRESLQLRGSPVGVGYAVNALRSERGERDGA